MNSRGEFTKVRNISERALAEALPRVAKGMGEDHNKNKQQVIIRRESQDLAINGMCMRR